MKGGARRFPLRGYRAPARRAWLALCLGLLAQAASAQVITKADYASPTTRYAHGVLGDAVEWGALRLTLADGRRLTMTLPEHLVFEDIAPRLADLDGDGAPEVITVEANLTKGARLAIYGSEGRITATPHIGQRNRWLAPIGAADMDGDGTIELAYIDRPHLAKTLRLWRYHKGRLTEIATALDLTNHKIGWDHIPGGIRHCATGPEIITANGDWSRIMSTRMSSAGLTSRPVADYTGPDSLTAALACP
ncbi:VCBS repeat-containing protein [uncultured Roseovarius sp.]|uniref:FG-GAP repeat domain-containing protein n=1 Tax=uncultured Roseovarius sp. TaxID=293344 RepID=UPI0025FC3C94|nr:VCBS repeat-containing protein [uncultured Roseovarius sp.]